MPWAKCFVGLLALLGHCALWVGVFNRAHAIGWPRPLLNLLQRIALAVMLAGLASVVAWIGLSGQFFFDPLGFLGQHVAMDVYFWLCFGNGAVVLGLWLGRTTSGKPACWIGTEGAICRVDQHLGKRPCGKGLSRLLAGLPGNQVLELEVNRKEIALARLPCELDGLGIVHLSDLHFTGALSREFFEFAVEQANALEPDFVAITGDIIDKKQCLPWVDEVLRGLQSRYGVFCVLGNHDLRVDLADLVQRIERAGLVYLGGRWVEVRVRGWPVVLAGNERPWLDAPNMARRREAPSCGRAVRVLLAHSPDQLGWARVRDFDLMLCGHMHGGQIRLPVAGAIVGPSRFGVKYSGGVYYERPTVLHVSRGLSGTQLVRIHCRPELTRLVLRPVTVEAPGDDARAAQAMERAKAMGLPATARLCPADEQTA